MFERIVEIENARKANKLIKYSREGLKKGFPQKNSCGLYWIYTSYSIAELCNAQSSSKKGAVNIAELSESRKKLKHIIKPETDNKFWIVYNGIGGGGKEDSNYDLGARIIQEFSNHEGTGSLKILGSSLNDLEKWRYSYVVLDKDDYDTNKINYETNWRLEYGWPILSKR